MSHLFKLRLRALWLVAGLCWALPPTIHAAEPAVPYQPAIAPASDEGQHAIAGFRLPPGFGMTLFAAEPMLANPVAFCLDEQGRVYVAETFRQGKGVEDNRDHMDWVDDDLAARTVEDRRAMFQKHLGDNIHSYGVEHDRVRLIEDTNGDGRADRSTVFADGFNDVLTGTGSGLLARGGDVYYACIPDLWLLRDTDGDQRADQKKSLHHGYGVKVAFRGHDSHGLRMGPDGRLYFSIGDRGLHIKTDDGRLLDYPDTGTVLRCEPDGSNLEVFASGLRNPQELAFDDHGNLFTGDNNSDSGDRARWVYVVEGGETGWRMHYQYLPDRGPWNQEKLWHPHHAGQAAYIVPPIINLGDGPSGLTYYPGTGLPASYQGHFFLCDFRGGPAASGIRSFALQPQGAGFELTDSHEFLWQVLATDVDFGPDGGMYVSDWVDGWTGLGKGRLYRLTHEQEGQTALVREVKQLLGSGFVMTSVDELASLLSHADQRVRQEAQFELARRAVASDAAALAALHDAAYQAPTQLGRIHGIWGLGQVERRQSKTLDPIVALLNDDDAEIRAQAAKVLGEGRVAAAHETLLSLLVDENARVRFFAAQALGKLGDRRAVPALLMLLETNNDQDPFLRHAAKLALGQIGDEAALVAATTEKSTAVRRGVAVALRRMASPEIARLLADADPLVVEEAARAIYDLPIEAAMPALAAILPRSQLTDPTLRRALNANFRLGKAEHAAALAGYAARADAPELMRIEAIQMLGSWEKPGSRDRLLGCWRPLAERSQAVAVAALQPALGGIFAGSDEVRKTGAEVAGMLGIKEVGPALVALASEVDRPAAVRIEAIKALERLQDAALGDVLTLSLRDEQPLVRAEGQRLLAKADPAQAIAVFQKVLAEGTIAEQQQAFTTLASMQSPAADELLAAALDRLLADQLAKETALDLTLAAKERGVPSLQQRLEKLEQSRDANDPLAAYRLALVGGDATRGRKLFMQKSELSCLRCHQVQGTGGLVGPDLSKVAVEKQRDYLLEAIVLPNKQIAKGFESVVVALDSGVVHTGILKREDAATLELMTAEGKLIKVNKDEIEDRGTALSPMPETLIKDLNARELRDLVEFLSTLKE